MCYLISRIRINDIQKRKEYTPGNVF